MKQMDSRTAIYIAKQCFNIGCASILFLDVLKKYFPEITGIASILSVLSILFIGDILITLYIKRKYKDGTN